MLKQQTVINSTIKFLFIHIAAEPFIQPINTTVIKITNQQQKWCKTLFMKVHNLLVLSTGLAERLQ